MQVYMYRVFSNQTRDDYSTRCITTVYSLTTEVPTPTQSSISSGSVNEDQLRLGKQRQVWFIPFVDKFVAVQVKLCDLLTKHAIP